ncbi:MAG: TolC family protein [Actinomycetota bacterium]
MTSSATLGIEEFLRQVEASYPKLVGAEAERRLAEAKRLEKSGAFDPVFTTGADYLRFNSTDKLGYAKSYFATDAAVELLLPQGTKIIAGGRFTDGDVKSPLSPTGRSGEYFFGFKIPLARGAGINAKLAALRQARFGIPLADALYAELRLEVLFQASSSYWDWAAAVQRREVARNILNLARTRAGAVKERAEAGDLPLIDIVEADQEVLRREEQLQKAERDVQKEALKLSLYLWEPAGAAAAPSAAAAPAVPRPSRVISAEETLSAREEAVKLRPELRALKAAREISETELRLARNLRLPEVDLSVLPGYDVGPGGVGPTIKAGVALGLPLRQRTADGLADQARLKLQKIEAETQLERQRIQVQVEDAVSAANQAYRRYEAAARELELAQRLEQAERDRFALGDSTLFLVNQRERATAEAAIKAISISAEHQQALAAFRAVTARL